MEEDEGEEEEMGGGTGRQEEEEEEERGQPWPTGKLKHLVCHLRGKKMVANARNSAIFSFFYQPSISLPRKNVTGTQRPM